MKNKTLKKVMAFSLAAFMAISAVGCGGNGDVSSTPATTDTTSESVAETLNLIQIVICFGITVVMFMLDEVVKKIVVKKFKD